MVFNDILISFFVPSDERMDGATELPDPPHMGRRRFVSLRGHSSHFYELKNIATFY